MHCYICITYMIILTSANPINNKDLSTNKKRSLFHDVIESLRIHSQLPEDINQNEDNNLAQYYNSEEYENEPELRKEIDFSHRRNDRLEMPGLKYRLPRDLKTNNSGINKEIVLYINTEPSTKSTEKPKAATMKTKKPVDLNDRYYITNKMAGQSQIGDRKTETVIRPIIIVNIKGFPDTIISENKPNANSTGLDKLRNYFNIKQEINLEKGKIEPKIKQEVILNGDKSKIDDMITCKSSSNSKDAGKRKFNGVLEVLFAI